ncbi:hybrid sensor histidine kinase/response regulator [Burkholderia pseudomultivorans]|uniref:ATP-binding protein n=1 Tax=Burkholderia pseudomultivorans TaxID=1207504 RepID=UPI00075B72BB|nr:ATP-binding protein [Burkholderia pseudomultivorans]KWI52187.1 hybrid sensor histidine kinase/response regulator [Burkholderia pseudomultivorans]
MPHSPLQSIRRYQSISMFGGGIVVTVLILIACALGMASIVYGYLDGERRNYLAGLVQTLNEIKVSETSFRNGVSNAQLIWRDIDHAPDSIVDTFYDNDQQVTISPYPSVVFGVPGQTDDRREIARYLSLSVLLARICAASAINRGYALVGYHYSTHAGVFALVPNARTDDAALLTPEGRARTMDALRVDFEDQPSTGGHGRPHVRWLPPFVDPLSGELRIRLAAQAQIDGEPFAVLVTEYAPDYLLSWLPAHPADGTFFVTTSDNRLVAAGPGIAQDDARITRLLRLDASRDLASTDEPVFRGGHVLFRGKLDNTGWTLAYALSWGDVIANVALRAGLLLGASLLTIAIMWTLLVRFHHRMLAPVYARSQRVFDSESLCRSVIEMAPIGLGLISRADGHFMLVSPVLAERIAQLGSDYRALSGQIVEQYRTRASSGPLQVDLVLPDAAADAAPLHLEVIACGARYQERDVLIVAVVDVTAKRQLVRQLEEAVRAADSANAAKSSFLAAMSHEIRTPLNVILGNLELLDRHALDLSQRSRVRTLRTAAAGLLELVSGILDFSKIEAGAMSVESIEFDVMGVIARELGAFAPVAKAKGLSLFCEIAASRTQRMRGDPTRLAQVFGNLLSNAIKFTAQGHVTARVLVVRGECGAAELAIAVEDTGIGIGGADLHKLFKAFSQVDATITRRYGGTGLGLALCDRLVTAMGGRISVTSAPGAGSCFTVRVPLGLGIEPFGARVARDAGTLLLVAPQPEWRQFALPHLSAWGFDVDVYECPWQIPAARHAHAAAIVLFGDADAWSRDALDRLGGGAPIVLATPDGPLEPVRAGRTIRVSSYALHGLHVALGQTLADTPAPLAGPREVAAPAAAVAGSAALRVLLADDASVNGTILREQLDVLGCTVRVAGLGRTALDLLDADAWDLLLIGTDLPDMKAGVLAQTVRLRHMSCDVAIVTSHLMPDDARGYAAAGVECVLTKPVTLARLRGVLASVAQRSGRHVGGDAMQA